MPVPVIWTTAPRMTFSALRRLLSDLGFREAPVEKPFIGFQHQDDPDAWFVFPAYRGNSRVAPHHLAQVRTSCWTAGA